MRDVPYDLIKRIFKKLTTLTIPESILAEDTTDDLYKLKKINFRNLSFNNFIEYYKANPPPPRSKFESLTFSSSLVLKFIKYITKDNDEDLFVVQFSLYSFIAWLLIREESDKCYNTLILIQLLNKSCEYGIFETELKTTIRTICIYTSSFQNSGTLMDISLYFKDQNDRAMIMMMDILSRLANQYSYFLQHDTLGSLVSFLPQMLSNQDEGALITLHSIIDFIPQDVYNSLVSIFYTRMLQNPYSDVPIINIQTKPLDKDWLTPKQNIKTNIGYCKRQLFQEVSDPSPSFSFIENWDFTEFIGENMARIFETVCEMINTEQAGNDFFSATTIAFQQESWEKHQTALFFFDIIMIGSAKLSVEVSMSVLPQLLSWMFSIADDSIRKKVFALFFTAIQKSNFRYLTGLLESTLILPFSLNDIIRYTSSFLASVPDKVLTSPGFIKAFSNLGIVCQDWSFNAPMDKLRKYELIRLNIIALTAQILQTKSKEVAQCYMNDDLFNILLFSYIFETKLRERVFKLIIKYVSTKGVKVDKVLMMTCMSMQIVITHDPIDVQLTNELLKFVNDVLSIHREESNIFKSIAVSLTTVMDILPDSEEARGIYEGCLHFFVLMNNSVSWSTTLINSFITAGQRIYNNNPSKVLLLRLMQLVTGMPIVQISHTISVTNPQFLSAILMIFIDSPLSEEAFDILQGMMEYSSHNCIQACSNGFDNVLLEKINEYRNIPEMKFKIDHLLDIAFRIAFCKSTPHFIYRFIRILIPEDGKLCYHHYHLLKRFTVNIVEQKSLPSVYLPAFSYAPYIEVRHIPLKCIDPEWTITTFLYIDASNRESKTTIFKIFDQNDNFLEVYYNGTTIAIEYNTEKFTGSAVYEYKVPVMKWFMLTVSKSGNSEDQNIVSLQFDFDCPFLFSLQFDRFQSDVSIHIMRCDNIYESNQCAVKMTSFMFANTKNLNEDDLIPIRPRDSMKNFDALASFIIKKKTGYLAIGNQKGVEGVEMEFIGKKLIFRETLIDILIDAIKNNIFLPLYNLLKYEPRDGTHPSQIAAITTDIFAAVLESDIELQKHFHKNRVTEAIQYLLESAPFGTFSYTVYLRFYALIESLSEEPLILVICRNILTNMRIISRTNLASQEKILTHWRKHFYVEHQKLFVLCVRFRVIIVMLRFYYFYDINEMNVDYFLKGEDINQLRAFLIEFSLELVQNVAGNNNFIAYVRHVAACQDTRQRGELLRVLLSLFSIYKNIKQKEAESVFVLLSINEPEHIKMILQIFLESISYGGRSLIVAATEVYKGLIVGDVINNFTLHLLSSNPSLFPIVALNSIRNHTLSWIDTKNYLDTTTNILFYAILLLSSKKHEQTKLIDWALNVAQGKFLEVIGMIGLLGVLYPKRVEDIILLFINSFIKKFGESMKTDNEMQEMFLKAASFYLFNRVTPSPNDSLVYLFDISPFGSFYEEMNGLDELLDRCFSFDSLWTKLSSLTEAKGAFGVRIDNDEWCDEKFALQIFEIFKENPIDSFKRTLSVIASFSSNSDEIREYADVEFLDKLTANRGIELCNLDDISNGYIINDVFLKLKEDLEYTDSILEEVPKKLNEYQKITRGDTRIFTSLLKNRSMRGERFWKQVWRDLMNERAPWEPRNITKKDIHWKRMFILNAKNYPNLIKRDWNFKDLSKEYSTQDTNKHRFFELPRVRYKLKDSLLEMMSNPPLIKEPCVFVTNTQLMSSVFTTTKKTIRIFHSNNIITSFKTRAIFMVAARRFAQSMTAVEFFLDTGESFFVDFYPTLSDTIITSLKPILTKVIDFSIPKPISNPIWESWVNNTMSTFEYLLRINLYAGRSFSDISQYPIFPWIIRDYNSPILDLDKASTFRDFSISTFESNKSKPEVPPCMQSRPLVTVKFMARLEPYTTLYCRLNFGMSKIFNNVSEFFKQAWGSSLDFRELIPEFFYMPEIFENEFCGSFDLPLMRFPSWASDALDFVYKHRKALESEYVGKHINDWIDFTFGCTQSRKKFNDILYPDAIPKTTLEDPSSLFEARNQIINRGSVPLQIFTKKHPSRKPKQSYKKKDIKYETGIEDIFIIKIVKNVSYDVTIVGLSGIIADREFDSSGWKASIKSDYIGRPFKPQTIGGFVTNDVFVSTALNGNIITITNAITHDVHNITVVYGNVLDLSADRGYFAIAASDSLIYVWTLSNFKEPKNTIRTFSSVPTALAVSQTHRIIVSGGDDGFCQVSALGSGSIVRVFDTQTANIKKIAVTEGWGFILVYSDIVRESLHPSISIYTINGRLIRRIQNAGVITAWCTFEVDGFDYYVYADDRGRVYAGEIYDSSNTSPPILWLKTIVIVLAYNKADCTITAITREGTMVVTSYTI